MVPSKLCVKILLPFVLNPLEYKECKTTLKIQTNGISITNGIDISIQGIRGHHVYGILNYLTSDYIKKKKLAPTHTCYHIKV